MKLTSLLTAALLPVGLMAAPVANEIADVVARESDDVSPNQPASGLSSRQLGPGNFCRIVGASVVNCRAGPGTGYKVVGTFSKGTLGFFSCVKSGECITIGGSTNW